MSLVTNVPEDDREAYWDAVLYEAPTMTSGKVPASHANGHRSNLNVQTVAGVRAACAAAGPRTWLLEGVWISGTPMVVGAEEKAGKSLALLDLAVSVASGTPWMNVLQVAQQGPVLCFWGEDDAAEVLRRLDAICEGKGVDADSLPLRLCFAVPNMSVQESLNEVEAELKEFPASVVILDPLYLAIGEDGDSTNLYKMGRVLRSFGEVCRKGKAAPVVITHWNKSGQGTGRSRITGTGTTQWARTIVSVSVANRVKDGERSIVDLEWDFTGNSIQPRTVGVQRVMWSDDEHDLNSALHYQVGPIVAAVPAGVGDVNPNLLKRMVTLCRWLEQNPGPHTFADFRSGVGGNAKSFGNARIKLMEAGYVSKDNTLVRPFRVGANADFREPPPEF